MAQRSTAFDWSIQNVEAFQAKINELGKVTNDFRIPFRLIASDFYRSNRKLFTLSSAGLYQDLAPSSGIDGNPTTTSNYKAQKERLFGKIYPILEATGVLKKSVLSKNAQHSVFILGKKELQMGTSDPVAGFHQSDEPRTQLPQRKIVFIDGGPADKSRDSSINGRRERWLNIVGDHITQLVTGRVL